MEINQGSLDWHRERLGYITSSSVYKLLGTKEPKTDKDGNYVIPNFGDTAMSYIFSKVAERMIEPYIVNNDEALASFINEENPKTKDMERGNYLEGFALDAYVDETMNNVEKIGILSYLKDDEILFKDSPDGLVVDAKGDIVKPIEIKCPKATTYIKYMLNIKDNESLKEWEYKYYIQVQCHMLASYSDECDFIAYDPRMTKSLHIVTIKRDERMINLILKVLDEANKIIKANSK